MKATPTTNILQDFTPNLVQVDAVTLKMKAASFSQTFDVSLTVHLSITQSIYQLDAPIPLLFI
jgi:hypothetical protein